MFPVNYFSLHWRFFFLSGYLKKVTTANAHVRTTKGTRRMRKARKYRRPEDLEDKKYYGIGPHKKVDSLTQSLASRGFPRKMVSYTPPNDVSSSVFLIYKKLSEAVSAEDEWQKKSLSDPLFKYKFLIECMKHFNYNIPNSYLCKLKTVGDVLGYFATPVEGTLPYEALIQENTKLPPNLIVIPDYLDFVPETDTFFNGINAYPGRRRVIHTKTGGKYEKIIRWPNI